MSRVAAARNVAFDVLLAVEESDAYANLLLPTAISRAGLSPQDAGLATELTYGTLRALGSYDAVIADAAGREPEQIDVPVLVALRLAVHQLLAMRVPPHAAVNESVEIVRIGAGRGAAGFTNAVLRRVTERDADEWWEGLEEGARSDDERLSLRTAHPVWVIRAFRRALAAEGRTEELGAMLAADNIAPAVSMIALPGLIERPDDTDPSPYSPYAFTHPGGSPERAIRESGGRLRVQDEGSQLAALALVAAAPIVAGERWLDLCAGPGGKTALLAAEASRHGAELDANEITPARAGLVRNALRAVPLEVQVYEEDGRVFAAERAGAYDRILVDAPCTGLGALRRRPEARWRKRPADVAELADLQAELLDAALTALRPGGVVAYVTCSPHLAETAATVAEALRRADGAVEELDARAVLRDVAVGPIDLPEPTSGAGHAQLWPHRHGTDAMFVSLLRRVR